MNSAEGTLACAVRGPIMLITIGSLAALDSMGISGFGRTWPVLIIVFGLLKLMERMGRPAGTGGPAAPAQGGGAS